MITSIVGTVKNVVVKITYNPPKNARLLEVLQPMRYNASINIDIDATEIRSEFDNEIEFGQKVKAEINNLLNSHVGGNNTLDNLLNQNMVLSNEIERLKKRLIAQSEHNSYERKQLTAERDNLQLVIDNFASAGLCISNNSTKNKEAMNRYSKLSQNIGGKL